MATKRMTSNDYAKELHKLELDRIALEKRMRARVNEMCQQNPNIVIGAMPIDTGKGFVFTKDYIDKLELVTLNTVFTVMQIIEEELAKQHPHKQTKLEFPSELQSTKNTNVGEGIEESQHTKLMNIAKGIQALNIPKSKS